MVPVSTPDFSGTLVVFFVAGTTLFIRLLTTHFISHNLLSFPVLLFLLHHPRTTRYGGKPLLMSNHLGRGKRRVAGCILLSRSASSSFGAVFNPFEIHAGIIRPGPAVLRFCLGPVSRLALIMGGSADSPGCLATRMHSNDE
jgi:hypothetical protein